jgi:hypothetical protein
MKKLVFLLLFGLLQTISIAAINSDEEEEETPTLGGIPWAGDTEGGSGGGGSGGGWPSGVDIGPEGPVPMDDPGEPVEVADLGKINTCSNDPRVTEASRGTVSTDDDLTRKTNANQMLQAAFPNVVNTRTGKGNRLRITIVWSDGGEESFEHTTIAGWISKGLTKVGDGKAGSACTAAGKTGN